MFLALGHNPVQTKPPAYIKNKNPTFLDPKTPVMASGSEDRARKRACNDDSTMSPVKKMKCLDLILVEKVYKFRVLLPNSDCVTMRVVDPPNNQMPVVVFTDLVKEEYERVGDRIKRRRIDWESPDLCLIDRFENRIKVMVNFESFETDKVYTLRLNDGSNGDEVYENMWDLTPDVELLRELPQEYAFESALADLIDNSLQAVWSNSNKRRLISVDLGEDNISIFDNGPGMDDSEDNSIVKWGKMGSSLHRSYRGRAIGGKPPYLKPFFGMFGYGGPISSMHLARHTIVSSKTKNSKKVYTLHLRRDALLSSSSSDKSWQAPGGLRDPSKNEMELSPDGTFTKVEMFQIKMRSLNVAHLQSKLKDIYFPYIQCDDNTKTGKTITPIEFQVNGIDLAEVEGGEVAVTNLNSCHGPHFVLQLHFTSNQEVHLQKSPGKGASKEANARLKFVYLPIVQGKENIERILEKLEAEGCGVAETFESFSRVSIRCLGRLLPDARWAWLPFMELKQRKVDRAQILKTCCSRVKCFIETDGGFYPTPSKTDLSHHHPYTTALKNFGYKPLEKERDVHIEIFKDGKKLSLQQVDKQYQDWIFQMHNLYDEESDCGEDEPVIIINPLKKKQLGISSDVIRVHRHIRRKGKSWRSGQKIKVLKGACAGVHKNNIYFVLEYILLEGFQGDAGGETRIICRQLGISDEKGCLVFENEDGNPAIDIRESRSLPISIIDTGKCLSVETAEWSLQLEKLQKKIPSSIDILCASHCEELDIEGSLPFDTAVTAGHASPDEVIAVVRPASYDSVVVSEKLDQKHIAVTDIDMVLEIKLNAEDKDLQENSHVRSFRASPSSRKGFRGLYIFSVKPKLIFEKAGEYTFSFHIKELNCSSYLNSVRVKALSQVKRWALLSDMQHAKLSVRVGSYFPPISIACYDVYGNRTSFRRVPNLIAKVLTRQGAILFQSEKLKSHLLSKCSIITVENLLAESRELDLIRPDYEAQLTICSKDEPFDVSIPCEVIPGSVHHLNAKPKDFMKQLLPGNVVQELELEVFDANGNHVKQGSELSLDVNGFHFQQKTNRIQVDDRGCIDLSGLLKVARGYGESVSLSVFSSNKLVLKEKSQTEKRVLRVATEIPEKCFAGSQLEDVVFKIVDSDGVVDETIDDNEKGDMSHSLVLKSDSTVMDDSVKYSFRHGCCTVRTIQLPEIEGSFSFHAAHSRFPKLNMTIKVLVEKAPEVVYESSQPQYTDVEISPQKNLSRFKTPKVEHDDNATLLVPSPDSAKGIGNLVKSLYNERKELEDKVLQYGTHIGEHEQNLKTLHAQRLEYEQVLSELQASVEANTDGDSNILGVAALLGSVETNELARILTEFLGEEQMLGVVCKSYKAAHNLETCDVHGNVNSSTGLQALASEFGTSLKGRYCVICLEDIRPYEGECDSGDPQRRLLLADPTLPNGKTPPGFSGYAVNMIYLDANQLYTRTSRGKGLRETLFYHLLGEVQVYRTRENMRKALECIHHGAVSLDGGIIRKDGVISLGCGKPSIHFPVVAPQSRSSRFQCLIDAKKSMLRTTIDKLDKENEMYDETMKKFKKSKNKYEKFLDEKAPLLQQLNGSAWNSPS
ncbi:Gamma-irradiation and mitomycin c induced 1 [Heracleum sosnowskyi]|uniref:Gamma-irradiation and mitomycin c induced 1 n=1 Tax=Heracleum sosnowskyi TaxID=360622 RepID=A0AAD8IXM2_9APIA|nr:Gamma-irradiation and mitomycin c induced 1 [Heracleum sosnowskyi]